MKLKHVLIKNFKGVREVEFSMDTAMHASRRLTALLGDNGSGKTSILQAIALTLSMATRRTRDLASFSWHGFLPGRVSNLGRTLVELEVTFEPEEVTLTDELFQAWQESLPSDRRQLMKIVPPSQHTEVKLRFEQGRVDSPQGFEAVNQFLGRYYVMALRNTRPELKDRFGPLPLEARMLLKVAAFRPRVKALGIKRLEAQNGWVSLTWHEAHAPTAEKVQKWFKEWPPARIRFSSQDLNSVSFRVMKGDEGSEKMMEAAGRLLEGLGREK